MTAAMEECMTTTRTRFVVSFFSKYLSSLSLCIHKYGIIYLMQALIKTYIVAISIGDVMPKPIISIMFIIYMNIVQVQSILNCTSVRPMEDRMTVKGNNSHKWKINII